MVTIGKITDDYNKIIDGGSYKDKSTDTEKALGKEIYKKFTGKDYVEISDGTHRNKIQRSVDALEGKSPLFVTGGPMGYVQQGLSETNVAISINKLPKGQLQEEINRAKEGKESSVNYINDFVSKLSLDEPIIDDGEKMKIYDETVTKYNKLSEAEKMQFTRPNKVGEIIDSTTNINEFAQRPLPAVLARFGAKPFKDLNKQDQESLLGMKAINLLEPVILVQNGKSEEVKRIITDKKTGIELTYSYTAGFLSQRTGSDGQPRGFINMW